MEAVFLAIISQLNSAVFVLLAILLMAFWATYKVGSLVTFFKETKSENKRTDLKIDDMRGTLSSVKATTDLLYQVHVHTMHKRERNALGRNSDLGN